MSAYPNLNIHSHPPIGTVGLTEPEAREKYGDAVKIYKSSFRALFYSMIPEEHKEPTMYKLIVVGEEEKVVGVHVIGMGSDEVMQGFGVAVKMGARKRDLDDTVAIHPTSAEGTFLPRRIYVFGTKFVRRTCDAPLSKTAGSSVTGWLAGCTIDSVDWDAYLICFWSCAGRRVLLPAVQGCGRYVAHIPSFR